MCIKPDQATSGGTYKHIYRQTDSQTDIPISHTCAFGAFKNQMVLSNHSSAETWFCDYSQSLLQRELSERTESSESLRESFESFHTYGEFFPPAHSPSNPSLEAQIPAWKPKSQSQGPNPSLEAQIPTLRLKSYPQSSNFIPEAGI